MSLRPCGWNPVSCSTEPDRLPVQANDDVATPKTAAGGGAAARHAGDQDAVDLAVGRMAGRDLAPATRPGVGPVRSLASSPASAVAATSTASWTPMPVAQQVQRNVAVCFDQRDPIAQLLEPWTATPSTASTTSPSRRPARSAGERWLDAGDQCSLVGAEAHGRCRVRRQILDDNADAAAMDLAEAQQLIHDRTGHVGGHREADADIAAVRAPGSPC